MRLGVVSGFRENRITEESAFTRNSGPVGRSSSNWNTLERVAAEWLVHFSEEVTSPEVGTRHGGEADWPD